MHCNNYLTLYLSNDSSKNDHVPPSAVKAFSEKETLAFDSVFPDLVRELCFDPFYEDFGAANKHLSKVDIICKNVFNKISKLLVSNNST